MQRNTIATACAAGLLIASAPALATFHLMKVVEVFPGTAASPKAQYVVIQMYTSGQNLVAGHAITVFDKTGALIGTFTFAGNVRNGASQAKILIATSQAEQFFGLTADLVMGASVIAGGGKVCWAGTIDCVAWGAYSGSSAGVGTPFNAPTGLVSGKATVRRLNISGSATTLDVGDDTDNSATDFVFGSPAPRNNAGVLGTVPMATCGNGVIEGLEQCDDHNLTNGDGCSSTCKLEAVTVKHAIGDFDGDGKSDVLWRNTSTGANAIWRSADSTTKIAVTGIADQHWIVAGRGDFNGDGKSDILWRNLSTGANSIWKSGNSATKQVLTTVAELSWKIVGVGDFAGDGKSDILWRNSISGADSLWNDADSTRKVLLAGVSDLAWKVVGIGDVNGDRKSDIVWRNTSTGADVIWKSANKSTSQAMAGVGDLAWKVVGIGDFNGDGKSDVFWRNTSTGADSIWLSAISTTKQATMGVTSQSWQVANIGDYTGDGKADVLWRNFATGANVMWISANASTQRGVTGVADLAWKIVPYEAQSLTP
jgi:cysteine-rich repeat protein